MRFFLAFARHSTVIIQQQIMFFKGKLKLKIKYDQVSAAKNSVKTFCACVESAVAARKSNII